MKKKLTALAALSLLMSLASCGSSEPSPSGTAYTEKTVSAQIYKKGNETQTVLRFS
jgi:ABC-type phosphate/phosphonate transport system substrate-binding protein